MPQDVTKGLAPSDLLTIKEAARDLQVHYTYLWRLVKASDIYTQRRGNYILVRRGDVEDLLKNHQPHTKGGAPVGASF